MSIVTKLMLSTDPYKRNLSVREGEMCQQELKSFYNHDDYHPVKSLRRQPTRANAKDKKLKIGDEQIMSNLSIPFQCPAQIKTPNWWSGESKGKDG